MILEILYNSEYEPLDIFEDFDIKYTHQYNDANALSSYKVPYTGKFKVPLNDKNRRLLGLPFDLALPKLQRIVGRVTRGDNDSVFSAVYEVERQVVNVLEPYVEITMLDSLTDAITQLGKYDLSDLLVGDGTNFNFYDTHIYSNNENLEYPDSAPFIFPFFNFNNKDKTFAHDPKRDLNQLQPTFIVSHFIKMIFAYVGVDINSKFLFEADQISPGIGSSQLGLMLPVRFFNDNECLFNALAKPRDFFTTLSPSSAIPRSPNFSTANHTTSMIVTQDFSNFLPNSDGPKMNWQSYVESITIYGSHTTSEYCSMVDGKLKIHATPNLASTQKMHVLYGGLEDTANTEVTRMNQITSVQDEAFGVLDVHLVVATFPEDDYNVHTGTYKNAVTQSYDTNKSIKVGTAVYVGLTPIYDSTGGFGDAMDFEITLTEEAEVIADVQANQRIELAFVLKCPEGASSTATVNMQYEDNSAVSQYTAIFDDDKFRYQWVSGESDHFDLMNAGSTSVTDYPINFEFSYPEATEYPPVTEYWQTEQLKFAPESMISLSESYENSEYKPKLIDLVKLVMERFNLTLYSLADGSIHIDTYENRVTGDFIIGHLIDEAISAEYRYNELGLFSMSDNNPGFYADGYNSIEKYVFNDEKKEVSSLSMGSCIVNQDGMFEDVYSDAAYEVLKLNNDSNYWGISDRPQAAAEDLTPTFCLITSEVNDIMFPVNQHAKGLQWVWDDSSNSYYISDSTVIVGFFNSFYSDPNTGDTYKSKGKAVNVTEGYTLESFRDDDIRNTNSTYMRNWRKRVHQLMDNDTVAISLGAYISEEDFSAITEFPVIDYFGDEWDLVSFSDFNFSGQDGGVTQLNIVKIEELEDPTEPPVPPEELRTVTLYGLGSVDNSSECGLTDNPNIRYYAGEGLSIAVGDLLYENNDLDNLIPWDGGNLWYGIAGPDRMMECSTSVVSIDTCVYHWKESRISVSGDFYATSWCGISPPLSEMRVVYHEGVNEYPVSGDVLYTNQELTNPVNGSGIWYKTFDYDNQSYNISSSGVITAIDTCVNRTLVRGVENHSHNTEDACSSSIYTETYWHNGASKYPTVGDTVYHADGSVVEGADRWWKMDNTWLVDIQTSGVIDETKICP